MPSTKPAEPASKLACPSANELRQYLAGWNDEAQAAEIDGHLHSCDLCNLALKDMESQPQTLLQSLQSTVGHAGAVQNIPEQQPNEADSLQAGSESPGPLDVALEKVKKLISAPKMIADNQESAQWQPALKELGMYDLIRPLGRGGMGAVYLAVHRQLRKQVTIKLLPLMSGEDSGVRARFEREIRVVGKLNHPSIVAATDAGEIDGTQFLVMEYVPGLDLSRLARLIGRLSVADSCELIRQVALGLSCAHAEGVVHRDVKPSNLMLDESGRIRILDFGLAQFSVWDEASVDLTTVGQLMGTLDYMAPEQAELSGNVDYRADLYALGATLFRLLCGRPPLSAAPNQSPLEKLRLLASQQPPKLATLCPEAPRELAQLVASMLSKNPQERPASAAHVAEQLAPLATNSRLIELLEKAKEKAASTPEPIKKSRIEEIPALLPNAPAAFAPTAMNSQPDNIGDGRRRLIRRLLLAAAFPLLIIAGTLIKVETSKGQLVIVSEIDNVAIRLVKNGKPLDGLQISHGTTSTRLQADNYEITIDGASDGLEIVNNQFTLKSGETVVARIHQKGTSPELATAPLPSLVNSTNITVPSDPIEATRFKLYELDVQLQLLVARLGANHPQVLELKQEIEIRNAHLQELTAERDKASHMPKNAAPLYDGQPLEHWLDMLSREKSATGLKTAFDACSALVTNENGEQIANVVLKVVPTLPVDLYLEEGRNLASGRTVDKFALPLLRVALPGSKYFVRWVEEFESGELAWRERLWKSYTPDTSTLTVEAVEPFIAWAEHRLNQNPVEGNDPDQDSLRAADQIRNMISIHSQWATEVFRSRVMRILTASPQLPISWWVSQPLTYRSRDDDREYWPTEFKSEVTLRAIEALQNEATLPALVIQASIILAHNTELNAEQRQRIVSALNRRLESLVSDRSAMTQMVQTAEEFTDFSVPTTDTQNPLYVALLQIEIRRSFVREIPVIENSLVLSLLNLSWKFDKGASAKQQLDQIFHATQGTFERIQTQATTVASRKKDPAQRSDRFLASRQAIHLLWPDLQPEDNGSGYLSNSGPVNLTQLATATLWGKYEPTKQDWHEYLILLHPVMTERVTQAVKEFAATPATEAAPAEKTE